MKRSIRTLTALLFLPMMAGLLQFGLFAGPSQLTAGGGVIQPEVTDALQQASEVAVIINLVGPATPIDQVTLAELQQNAAARQASVLAGLTASDFTLTNQYQSIHALAGRITASGSQKLTGHPDVVSVSIDGEVFATLEQSVPLIRADEVHLAGFDGTGVAQQRQHRASVLLTKRSNGHRAP